jgi:hypothetical protein
MSAPRRLLLFGAERYAIPILAPLARAARARGDEVAWYLHGFDLPDLSIHEEHLGRLLGSVAAVRQFGADACLAASNWIPDFFPGLKVQVFHGFNVEKRDAAKGHFRIRGLFDLYCTQGPATTAPFQAIAARDPHFEVVETGWPKLDPLFRPDTGTIAGLRAPAAGRRVLAFGSTFTERLSCAPLLVDWLAAEIARGEHFWLLTLHPKCPRELTERYRALAGPNAAFVETEQLMPMLAAAEVLLADTSSIVPEFAVQGRPVVTFRNRAPKPYMIDVRAIDALPAALARALAPDAALQAALVANADAIHPRRDGHASERVLAAVDARLAGGGRTLASKPLNLWRRLEMRARMRYWRP